MSFSLPGGERGELILQGFETGVHPVTFVFETVQRERHRVDDGIQPALGFDVAPRKRRVSLRVEGFEFLVLTGYDLIELGDLFARGSNDHPDFCKIRRFRCCHWPGRTVRRDRGLRERAPRDRGRQTKNEDRGD